MRQLGRQLENRLGAVPTGLVPSSGGLPFLADPQTWTQDNDANEHLGPDGKTWDQAGQPCIDQYGKQVELVQNWVDNIGLVWAVSNDHGVTWTQLSNPGDYVYPVPVTRASITYNPVLDAFEVAYKGEPRDGVIYRRYFPQRDGSNNIIGMTTSMTINLQIDKDRSEEPDPVTMVYEHIWIEYRDGYLIIIYHARNDKVGFRGTEVRAVKRQVSHDVNDGNPANWTGIGLPGVSVIGNTPQTASYSALYQTTTWNGRFGWPCPVWVPSDAADGADDLVVFYADTYAAYYGWKVVRATGWTGSAWASLSSPQLVNGFAATGSDTGYNLKEQIGTMPVVDTATGDIYFSNLYWKNNSLGDTWAVWRVQPDGTIGLYADVYSGLAANMHPDVFITGSLMWDALTGTLAVAYTDLPQKDIYMVLYQDGAPTMDPLNVPIPGDRPCDIPVLVKERVNDALMLCYRDFNLEARDVPPTYSAGLSSDPDAGYQGYVSHVAIRAG